MAIDPADPRPGYVWWYQGSLWIAMHRYLQPLTIADGHDYIWHIMSDATNEWDIRAACGAESAISIKNRRVKFGAPPYLPPEVLCTACRAMHAKKLLLKEHS